MTTHYSWEHTPATRGKVKKTDELIRRTGQAKKYVEKQRAEQPTLRVNPYYSKDRKIREGARVVLSDESPYTDSPENPREGGSYTCIGTVEYASARDDVVEVVWDGGTGNTYVFDDLVVVEDNQKDNQRPRMTTGRILSKAEEAYTGKFIVGTAVYLLPKFYSPQQSNPCLGSKHQCVGKVSKAVRRSDNYEHIAVNWSNGARNGYTFVNEPSRVCLVEVDDYKALKQLLKNDPNFAFRVQLFNTSGIRGAVAEHLNVVLEGE